MNIDAWLNRLLRLVVPAVAIIAAAIAVVAVIDRLAADNASAERRELIARGDRLTALALAPGSALACLDSGAGETAESACEAAVFASPQSTAAAVSYVGARLKLIADAKAFDPAADTFAAARRAIELDRYGIAAHVLAARDLCTPERCAAFAWLADSNALKANMKAQAFDQYVSRHTAAWTAPAAAAPAPEAVSAAPPAYAAKPMEQAAPANPPKPSGELVAHPLSSKYTLPSAASIPPVSIMNAEPPLPKAAADALAAQSKADAKPEADKANGEVPIPPKRPQAPRDDAAPPPTVR